MVSKNKTNLDRIKKNIFGNGFNVNATGTLNLLELTKKHCSNIPFIFMSTNKVYGDNQNKLNLIVYNIIII